MNNYLSPAELLASYSAAGVRKMERSAASLLLLGALAGAIIAIAAAATNTAVYGISDTWTVRTICGLLFPFGLGLVVVTGAELFTGNCMLPLTLLEKKGGSAVLMVRNWALVFAGNALGSLLVAWLCVSCGQLDYSAGALAVSMIPPYYYKFSMDEIMGYYEDVIRAIPDVPAIVYNIPQFTGVEFSKENAGRLLSNENIVGIKHTSTNLYSLERMGQAFPGKALINGFDEQLLGALAMGSCATIGTTVNLFAPLFHRVRDAFDRGDMAQAYRWQHAINLRVEETVKLGIFNAMKYGWTLRGVDCGFCRAPFRPLDGAAREKMAQLMALPLEPV